MESNKTETKGEERDILALRKAMGTLPADQPPFESPLYVGVEGLRVELIDKPENPYKAIYTVVTATWGDRKGWKDRWENATPEGRLKVVLAALSGGTLRQALECGSFTFNIQGCSRGAFDQLARHRSSGIGSVGSRDNSHLDAALIVPPQLWAAMNNDERANVRRWWKTTKVLYKNILEMRDGKETWQNARYFLPMGMEWRFAWTMNLRALWDSVMPQRLPFCEQFDTVSVAWAMWMEIWEHFPLLAAHLRPRCDWAKKCTYAEKYKLSELFGCLFKPCGRYPYETDVFASFNESSTSAKEIDDQLGIATPRPQDWDQLVKDAIKKDMHFFEED